MVDDFYVVLGISRDAGLTQIRRAYRRLSMRFHPEVAGEGEAEHFDRIREAYQTLSHPARKADYDRELTIADQARAAAGWLNPLLESPIDLMGDFESVKPGAEEILRHILSNYTGDVPKSHPVRELVVEVMLTPDQAARGGQLPMLVPVARVCARCGGTGRTGFFTCDECMGHGTIWEKARVDVPIPQGLQDGAVIETPLKHLGIRNMWLKTRVRVANA